MAIAYRSNTTGQHDGSVASTTHSVTLNKPSGLATGDCLVVVISGRQDDGASRDLASEVSFSGFTLVSESAAYTATAVSRKWVFRKAITDGAGEPASYTFTATGSSANKLNLTGIAGAFSGVDTASPVDASSTFDGEVTSTTLTFNGVTTTTANTMLVMCGAARRGTPTATFNDGTEIAESAQAGTAAAGGGTTAYMGYLAQASAGASGNKTATLTESRENDGLIVALKESAPSGLTITSVTPSSFDDGIAGIVIAGAGFGASQGSSTLTIGGQAQTVTAWSNTSITITSARGSNSMGAGQLKVTIR
jgi:hypothetical protein